LRSSRGEVKSGLSRRLQRVDVANALAALQERHVEVGDAAPADLALLAEPGHGSPALLDRTPVSSGQVSSGQWNW
jgi:hypothetical protein